MTQLNTHKLFRPKIDQTTETQKAISRIPIYIVFKVFHHACL